MEILLLEHLAAPVAELISAYGYQHCILDDQVLDRAISQINDCGSSHTICIIKAGVFDTVELVNIRQIQQYMILSKFLVSLNKMFQGKDFCSSAQRGTQQEKCIVSYQIRKISIWQEIWGAH